MNRNYVKENTSANMAKLIQDIKFMGDYTVFKYDTFISKKLTGTKF